MWRVLAAIAIVMGLWRLIVVCCSPAAVPLGIFRLQSVERIA
jgi:hypothetical protein